MKGHILAADMVDNISTVTKQTKYGTFTCSVKVHESDQDIANVYDGCYFAEMKCDIKAYHEKALRMKERAISASHIYDIMATSFESSDPCMIKLWKQVENAWARYEQAQDTYQILKDSYSAFIETVLKRRREIRSRINARHNEMS